MKRYLGTLVLVSLLVSWIVNAGCGGGDSHQAEASQASLSISPNPLVGSTNHTLLASVQYSAHGALVAGLQFDVLYDPSPLSLTNAPAGKVVGLANKSLTLSHPSSGDTRFLVFGVNQDIIGDGNVADLTFQVRLNAPAGPHKLYLSNIVGVGPNGNPVTVKNLNPP
jgi:hypothetical protein